MQDTEIFLPIKGYEGIYEISNHGRVKSLQRVDCRGQKRKEKMLVISLDSDGYPIIILSKDRVSKTNKVHRLVAYHFISIVEGKTHVNHIDGVKTNNKVYNLEWCTNQENIKHARVNGLHPEVGETHKCATLTNEQVLKILLEFGMHTQIAKKYNTSPLIVGRIKSGKTWSSVTGIVYNKKKFK